VIYGVVVTTGKSKADGFASALHGEASRRSVYVVGLSESDAFAAALLNQNIVLIDEPTVEQMLSFVFSEAIGTEDGAMRYDELVQIATDRAAKLQSGQHPHH
jgi:hypothetical protein